jgi:hypothetical protein
MLGLSPVQNLSLMYAGKSHKACSMTSTEPRPALELEAETEYGRLLPSDAYLRVALLRLVLDPTAFAPT